MNQSEICSCGAQIKRYTLPDTGSGWINTYTACSAWRETGKHLDNESK